MIRYLVAHLLLASAVIAPAQQETVTTRIFTYAPAGLPESFEAYYRSGQNIERFLASAGTLGLPIAYTGPPVFSLFSSKADFAPEDGKPPAPPLATATLPADSDCVLLVCTRNADGKTGLIAYDIRSDELKPGDYRVFNFSKTPVSIMIGSQRLSLTPGKDAFARDAKWHSETLAFPLQIATHENGKSTLVFSTFWEHYPQRRSLLFLFDGKHASEPIIFANFSADLPARAPASAGVP